MPHNRIQTLKKMKKVLFISSRPIFPIVSGDRIRIAQQLEFLVKRYIVDVVYLCELPTKEETSSFLPQVNTVRQFVVPRWKCYLQTIRFLFNSLPLQVNYYFNSGVANYIKQHAIEYDIVFCIGIRTAEYARYLVGPARYIDFVDAVSMNYEKAERKARGLKRLIYSIDSKRCKRYEHLLIAAFEKCAIISDIDKNYILKCEKKYIQ